MPFFKKHSTSNNPASAGSGRYCGNSASNPASIPAHGINEQSDTKISIALLALPNKAPTAPVNPPYFLPRLRNRTHAAQNSAEEKITGRKNPPVGKNETSSAPDKNPAPILVPTIKSVLCITPTL